MSTPPDYLHRLTDAETCVEGLALPHPRESIHNAVGRHLERPNHRDVCVVREHFCRRIIHGRETNPTVEIKPRQGLERAAEAQARNAESLLPGRPSSLSIRQASESSVRVTWATPSPAATTIEIKWWPRTSSPEQASSSSVASDQTSITLSNISAGVMYEVQVLASVESEEGSFIAEPVTGSFLIPPGQASPGNSGGDSPPGNGNSPSTPPGQSSGEDNGPTEDWPSPPGLNRDDPPGRGNGQGNGR